MIRGIGSPTSSRERASAISKNRRLWGRPSRAPGELEKHGRAGRWNSGPADAYEKHRGTLAGLTVTFLGDGASNMAQSYLLAGAVAGMHVRVASPAGYAPDATVVSDATALAATSGGSITLFTDPADAVAGVDVVVTDTWVSMGKEDEKTERIAQFGGYRVDGGLMALAASDALFLHCLPADRGYEVTADVIDGPQSVVWDEAENRLHAQKALMVWLLERAG